MTLTCRLTAKNRDQLQNTTLGNRAWASFFIHWVRFDSSMKVSVSVCTVVLIGRASVCWAPTLRAAACGRSGHLQHRAVASTEWSGPIYARSWCHRLWQALTTGTVRHGLRFVIMIRELLNSWGKLTVLLRIFKNMLAFIENLWKELGKFTEIAMGRLPSPSHHSLSVCYD